MYNDPKQTQPDQPPYRQPPPYGQPPQAPYNQPPYGQPQQVPFGQQPTQYMAPAGRPPYGVPPGPTYAAEQQPKPRRRGRVLWIVLGIIVVLVLACIGGAIALFNFVTNNGATNTVNQYYTAVEQQDYATAYTYLDSSGIGLNGQALTQALYIQANQTIDFAKGKVSSYAITSTSNNSNNGVNTAAITVSVTRNGQSYDVHLQLRQESNGWKIVQTDNI
jgi:NTF2-like N-terminal transpeptidase domain